MATEYRDGERRWFQRPEGPHGEPHSIELLAGLVIDLNALKSFEVARAHNRYCAAVLKNMRALGGARAGPLQRVPAVALLFYRVVCQGLDELVVIVVDQP